MRTPLRSCPLSARLTEGTSKAEAVQAIFSVVHAELKEVVVAAFVEGANLTPKGEWTYWYPGRRNASNVPKESSVGHQVTAKLPLPDAAG